MRSQPVLYEVRDQIAWVTLNRPKVMNAINHAMSRAIVKTMRAIEGNDQVRVVIFKGAGERAFSSGMDLRERAREVMPSYIERRRQKVAPGIELHTQAVAAISKPTIAAVHGYAIGGGLEIALACDFRIATEDSKFGLAEVRRGIIPGWGGTQRLPRLIGLAKALEMCMTGDLVDGKEGLQIGLVNMLLPPELLLAGAERYARLLLKRAPVALRFVKEALYKGTEMPLDQGLRLEADLSTLVATTEDSREGPLAFTEKREPVWKGK
jgi:enoyl-CoA hydratase